MSDRSGRFASKVPPVPRLPRLTPGALAALFALAGLALPPQPADAQPDAAQIIPGNVTLELPRTLPLSLDVPKQTLETVLCGYYDGNGGAGEVGLTSSNDGTSGFIVPILEVVFGVLTDTARVSAGGFHWPGAGPAATSCGPWSYAITLDPDAVQPTSELVLGRTAGSEPTAPFAGNVEAAALIRFSALADGGTWELPVLLRLEIAGRWTVVEDTDAPLADGDSNLVLVVERAAAALRTVR
jgi:hypothetical protein